MDKPKILLVDDDPDVAELVRITLEANGYQFYRAANGPEGLKMVKEIHPDLIILDVMMETNSAGFELSREFKTASPSTKVLMLTGVDQAMNIDFKSEAGNADWLPCDDYLSKPVVPKTLLEKVTALLS